MQEINGAPAYLADVTFDRDAMLAHAQSNGHGHLSSTDLADLAFSTLLRSYVIADGTSSQLQMQEGERSVSLDGLDQLGSDSMIILGAHGATAVSKGVNGGSSFSGTALDDILEGHHSPTANHPDMSRAVLYGLAGDDILMGGGGSNLLYGGEGIDTAFYGYASNSATQGITVDMATTVDGAVLLHNGIRELSKPMVAEGADLDYLYRIENIVGSDRDDIIRGDDGDNVLASGMGDDILAGRGGRDSFMLNGGTNTIEDFTPGEDRILIAGNTYAIRLITQDGTTVAILLGLDPSHLDLGRDVQVIEGEGSFDPITGRLDSTSRSIPNLPESTPITPITLEPAAVPGVLVAGTPDPWGWTDPSGVLGSDVTPFAAPTPFTDLL
jgi:hypothetical protein